MHKEIILSKIGIVRFLIIHYTLKPPLTDTSK